MKIFYVINDINFFISHRLDLALRAKKYGWEVFIIGDNYDGNSLDKLALSVIHIEINRSSKSIFDNLRLIKNLGDQYKKYQPDIIHHITLKPIIFGSIAAKLYQNKAKIINAVSGLGVTFANRNGISFVIRTLLKFSLSPNHHFIFQNESDLEIFKNLNLIHSNFIITNGSGVNKKIFSYASKKPREKVIITLTARMLKDKGILVLREAAKILEKNYFGKIEFYLFGPIDNDNPSALTETELTNLNIKDYFIWKGNSDNIIQVLNQTDIYCLPTHYGEGIPKSIIEALAIGRPVITTNIPGCNKCIIEGENGYLVPIKNAEKLAEKIEVLINNKSLREKMGKNSRALFENEFTLEKVVNRTFELYDKVIKT